MRKYLIYAGAALLAMASATLTGCGAAPANAPIPPKGGEIITISDPRDQDQCRVQPRLAWCKNYKNTQVSR